MSNEIGTVGFGVAITLSAHAGFAAMITNVSLDGYEVGDVDMSNNSITDGFKRFVAAALKDPGNVTVELLLQPGVSPPVGAANETITITLPVEHGNTNPATWACDGYMKSFKWGAPMDDKMTATAVLKLSGEPTITAGS